MALARMTWTYKSRTHQELGTKEQIVTDINKNKAQQPSTCLSWGQTLNQILLGSHGESEWVWTLQPPPFSSAECGAKEPGNGARAKVALKKLPAMVELDGTPWG